MKEDRENFKIKLSMLRKTNTMWLFRLLTDAANGEVGIRRADDQEKYNYTIEWSNNVIAEPNWGPVVSVIEVDNLFIPDWLCDIALRLRDKWILDIFNTIDY